MLFQVTGWQLNGWQRLWIVAVVLYLLIVCVATINKLSDWHDCAHITANSATPARVIQHVTWAEVVCAPEWKPATKAQREQVRQKFFNDFILPLTPKEQLQEAKEDFYRVTSADVENSIIRPEAFGYAFLWWLIPSAMLYIIGLVCAWIARGFGFEIWPRRGTNNRQPVESHATVNSVTGSTPDAKDKLVRAINIDSHAKFESKEGPRVASIEHHGVGGWLALFVAAMFFGGIVQALNRAQNFIDLEGKFAALASNPRWVQYKAISWCILAVAVALRVVATHRLTNVYTWKSVHFSIITLFVSLPIAQLFHMINGWSHFGTWGSDGLQDLAEGVVIACVWTSYLLLSKRVKNTYAPRS